MNTKEIKLALLDLGLIAVTADTYPNTFVIKDKKTFLDANLGTRANTPWRLAEYIFLLSPFTTDQKEILGKWKNMVGTDPTGKNIQKLCVPVDDDCVSFDVYDASGMHIKSGSLNQIVPASKAKQLVQDSSIPPKQIIYYGVPGCGKSHEVQKETKSLPKDRVMRVVFHPDYSNADFVGQILPHVDGKDVSYEFTPGPFAKILKKALRSNEPHALVIEEINRGNAAAIFGEVFQLLDRYRDEKPAGDDDWEPNIGKSRIGWSKYSIINEELEKYIVNAKDAASGAEATVVDENKVPREHMLECGLVFHVGDGIRIPPNLSIYATMNTSDQNVFTLDNAFQRRWEMKQIPNTLNNAEEGEEKKQYECEIEATGVQWGLFRDAINELIMESAQESGLSSMEDKRLGGWFITPDKDGVISKDAFANKVLKYLWDDAFKFDRQKHFGNAKTLEDLIERFTEDAGFNVFQDSSIKNLKSAEPIDSGEDDGPAEPADGTAES